MIKKLFLFAVLLSVNLFPQSFVRGGMGIQFQSSPSLTDYINQNFASPAEQLASFSSSVIFSAEGGTRISANTELALEVAYLINSYTYNYDLGQYDLSYGIMMPSLIYYYVIDGAGYNFKFGGGAGIRLVNAEEKLPRLTPVKYTSNGFGVVLKADGNTILGGNFYANIGGEIRYDLNGEPENNGDHIRNNIYKENVNFNSLGFGVRLGITYQF